MSAPLLLKCENCGEQYEPLKTKAEKIMMYCSRECEREGDDAEDEEGDDDA